MMTPAISQVCSLHAPFEKDVEDYSAAHCRTLEVWLTKLETYLEKHSLDAVKQLLSEHEMTCPVASFQGGLLISQGDARKQHWAHFAKRLELCGQLGIGTLVVAGDVLGPITEVDLQRAQVSLVEAAKQAAEHNVRIALEFQAQATFPNNLASAIALVESCGAANLGVCLDVFHYYLGPSKSDDWALLHPGNLFHVQVCDLSGRPREFATDSDRILPGDGDFLLAPLVAHLQQIGYAGCVSMELMNPILWQVPPRQLGEVGMTALRKVLGQASMD